MARKGCYRYVCKNCGEKVWLNRRNRTTRFGQTCRVCGGHHLIPTNNSIAKEKELLCCEARQIQIELWEKKTNIISDGIITWGVCRVIIEGIMERVITEREEQAIRLCHHDFDGMSVNAASIKMGTTVTDVKELLASAERKAPQLFPIITTRQRAIIGMYDEHLSRKEIVELLGITKKILEREVTFLRKRGLLFNRKPDQYDPTMDGRVKERF